MFLGGGALFFARYAAVRPAVLSDLSAERIAVYAAAKHEPSALLAELGRHQAAFDACHDEQEYDRLYYTLRDTADSPRCSGAARAARLIALNKTCFNGLERTNKSGKNNAPAGKRWTAGGKLAIPRFCDPANVYAVSRALQGVDLRVLDAVPAIDAAQPRELIYLDPPYEPRQEGGFVGYTGRGFTWEDQIRVAQAGRRAADRGAIVAASNHDLPHVRELYGDLGFAMHTLHAARSVNSKGTRRGAVAELIMVRGYARDKR